jgi:hypothetical protein
MTIERCPVSTRDRTGQRIARSEAGNIVNRRSGEIKKCLQGEPGRRCNPLDVAHEGNNMVRCNASGRVVANPIIVVNIKNLAAQDTDELLHLGIASNRKGNAARQALRTEFSRWQGNEGM